MEFEKDDEAFAIWTSTFGIGEGRHYKIMLLQMNSHVKSSKVLWDILLWLWSVFSPCTPGGVIYLKQSYFQYYR